ncbi:MAG: amidase, partial [Dehalococcoidia bacterium]|nr:amidase [Dehalococcoidia bacterium]
MTAKPSLTRPAPLVRLAAALRGGPPDVAAHIEDTLAWMTRVEPHVRTLLPEDGRRERLVAAIDTLVDRFPARDDRPALYGVPVGVKDIFAVDGLPTRAGSALPPEAFKMPEGAAVRRLRAAGAVVLGKTVTTEFAYFDPGATTNPLDTARTPGGSSSGSAAAVAAGIVPLAIGSQTVGSVIRPAAFCGIVGFKPSYGRIPTDGVLYYSPSVDHVGCFAQDVEGLRLAASVLLDGWTPAPPLRRAPVIGVPVGPYLDQVEPAAFAAFAETLVALTRAGVEVRRLPVLDDIVAINDRHRWLATAEFGEQHAARFERYGSLYRAASAALFDAAREVTPEQRAEGLGGREALRARLDAAAATEGIDAWAMPAA